MKRAVSELAVALLAALGLAGRAHAQDGADPEQTRPAAEASESESVDPAVQAELDAIMAQATSLPTSADEPSLSFYGFADANLARAWPNAYVGSYPPRSPTFFVGNVNLYGAANLTHGFSSLIEVRFSYLPNGSISNLSTGFNLNSTAVTDYAETNRTTRWGGIVLERVHLDYAYHSLLNFRLGQWLTNYGVWNVDHGSPTVIPVNQPYTLGEQLLPNRQVGLQVYGSHLFGSTTFGYSATVSNGRNDIDFTDSDNNKALGGRLFVSTSEIGDLTFGVSIYGGTATREPVLRGVRNVPPQIETDSKDRFSELSLATDLVWQWQELRVQAEFMAQQVEYRQGSRKLTSGLAQATGFVPDHTAWGTYVLVAYRLPWLGIMPYAMFEQFDRGYAEKQLLVLGGNNVNVTSARIGLNIRPIPAVVLKAQFSYSWFPGTEYDADLPQLSFQAAWAF